MAEEQRQLDAWLRYWPLLAVAVGVLLLGCVLVFPRLLYPPLTTTELRARGVRSPKEQVQLQDGRLKLQNDARTTLLQALGGLLVLSTAGAGAYTAWRQLQDNRRQQQHNEKLSREQLRLTQKELRLTRESQITERYTKAVEQLGATDKLDVRLGGIYALERVAVDSKRDHRTVVEVLSAFVREESIKRDTQRAEQGVTQEAVEADSPAPLNDATPRPAPEIQAALTVLGRLPQRPGISRGGLAEAQLSGARLDGADLSGAQLGRANLSGAQLDRTNLSGAQLVGANLYGARLDKANLSGAQLVGADLRGADLVASQERCKSTHAASSLSAC